MNIGRLEHRDGRTAENSWAIWVHTPEAPLHISFIM